MNIVSFVSPRPSSPRLNHIFLLFCKYSLSLIYFYLLHSALNATPIGGEKLFLIITLKI